MEANNKKSNKKQLILWVLNLLNTDSDENHPITQTEIAKVISDVYPCDRKTVCRNIKFLQEMGYPIKKKRKGFYMGEKRFSVEEVDFVKTAIMEATGKEKIEKTALAEKVSEFLSRKIDRRE